MEWIHHDTWFGGPAYTLGSGTIWKGKQYYRGKAERSEDLGVESSDCSLWSRNMRSESWIATRSVANVTSVSMVTQTGPCRSKSRSSIPSCADLSYNINILMQDIWCLWCNWGMTEFHKHYMGVLLASWRLYRNGWGIRDTHYTKWAERWFVRVSTWGHGSVSLSRRASDIEICRSTHINFNESNHHHLVSSTTFFVYIKTPEPIGEIDTVGVGIARMAAGFLTCLSI